MNYASAKSIRRDVLELLPPPKRLPMSQNVAELLRVEMNGSMVPWDATLTPYVLEPLNCLDSRRYDAVVLVAPARTGKSVALVDGWLLNSITRDRADHLLVQVSQEKAAEHSKRRLQRAFQASPEVKAALSTNKHDNAIHEIKTKAGNFLKCGWPSKNIFSSSDWKRVILTDLDRMPLDIGGEGSPFMLASKRTQTFMSSGMVMAESSPAHAITDLAYRPKSSHESPPTNGILSIYNQGDRRLYMWQCPSCGEFSEPLFERLVWDANQKDPNLASKDVSYCCPECGDTFREDQRIDKVPFKIHANNGGIWLPEGCSVDQDRVVTGAPRDSRIASFWMKGGVTSAFQSWSQLIFKYVGAMNEYEETGLTETLQTVVNTDMGMPFAPPRSSENSADGLMARRSDLGTKMVPPDVRFLLASVDVQGGSRSRFVVQIEGYGVGLESTIIDRFEIEKSDRKDGNDPDKFVRVKPHQYAEDWQVLVRKVIQATYEIDDGSGRRMGIAKTACDSAGEGGTTSNAYEFYRSLKKQGLHRSFHLIKGRSTAGSPIIEMRMPDTSNRKDRKSGSMGDVPVLFLQTNKIKDITAAALGRETVGPRYCHFPKWLPSSFFDELVAEERDAVTGHWSKISASSRNEAFDLKGYCWGLIHLMKAERINWDKPPAYALPLDDGNINVFECKDGGIAAPTPKRRRRASSF